MWAHTLDLRPVFAGRNSCMCMLCTPSCVAGYTQCRDKPGVMVVIMSTLGCHHVCTIARVSAECVAPVRLQSGDTENGMSCALGFLATCPEIQPRSTGKGPIGLEGRLTWSVNTLARGSQALEACASPSVKNCGEPSKYPSTGLYLAHGKWHGAMPLWGMKWATP
jgi:hypothetical protein